MALGARSGPSYSMTGPSGGGIRPPTLPPGGYLRDYPATGQEYGAPPPTPKPIPRPNPTSYTDPNGRTFDLSRPFVAQYTPPSPYQQAQSFYASQAGPQLAQLGLSDAVLGSQQASLMGNQALQSRYLNQDLGFGNRQHDLQQAGVNIDRGAADRQLGYLAELMGMNTTDLQRRLGFVDQYQGLAQQSSDRQLGYVGKQRGFEQEGFGLDKGNIAEQYEREMRAQRDDAAARGAGTSTGHRSAIEDIGQDRQFRFATRELQNRATKAGLTDQEFGIREGLAKQLLGFNEQRGELNSQYARDQLGLRNQQASTKDQLKTLDLRAQEIGLSRDQMKSNIQRQLEKSNLDMFFGVNDVMNALNSNDIQRQQLAEQIIRQATANQQFFGG